MEFAESLSERRGRRVVRLVQLQPPRAEHHAHPGIAVHQIEHPPDAAGREPVVLHEELDAGPLRLQDGTVPVACHPDSLSVGDHPHSRIPDLPGPLDRVVGGRVVTYDDLEVGEILS